MLGAIRCEHAEAIAVADTQLAQGACEPVGALVEGTPALRLSPGLDHRIPIGTEVGVSSHDARYQHSGDASSALTCPSLAVLTWCDTWHIPLPLEDIALTVDSMEASTGPTEPLSVRIASSSGAVRVIGEDRADVVVDGSASQHREAGLVTIEGASGKLTVRVPAASDVVIGADSGAVEVVGPVGHVAVTARSGRVVISDAQSTDVRADSGRVEINGCRHECRVRGDSGRVKVVDCGPADVTTRSGRIAISGVRGNVRAHCVSGRVAVELDRAADVDAETVSGSIDVRYPPGVTPRRTDDSDETGGDCVLRARAVSGRVTVENR